MRFWIAVLALFGALSLASPAAAQKKEKLPSAYDERRDWFMDNGKQNMPFRLWGPAIEWNKKCYKGKVERCERLARAFEDGAGDMPGDMRVAIAYWMKACNMGSGPACSRAATIFRDGSAGFTKPDLARKMAERGCTALKDQPSCAELAMAMGGSGGGDPQAAALAEQSCAAGAAAGCMLKANALFYEKKDAASVAQALGMFEKACAAKHAWGCQGLYDAYAEGRGVNRDPARAAQAVANGCTQSQGEKLRMCTLHGINLTASAQKATLNKGENFLSASCTAGDGLACLRIGQLGYGLRGGATTTPGEGLFFLRRGCDLNNGEACEELARAYVDGTQVKADLSITLALREKACRIGYQASCGVAKDMLARTPSLRANMPPIDPSLPVAEQLRLAKAAVDRGGADKLAAVYTVHRLTKEENEDASWLLGGWMVYGLPGVFEGTSRKADGLVSIENAARVGHVDAAIFMGMAYWYGDGVTEDRPKGENYMAIAAMRGSEMAKAIYRSMKLEPVRQENARRWKAMEEAAAAQRSTWSRSWSSYTPSWSAPSPSYTSSSGQSVASIIDNSNWNQRINYLSGSTTACPTSNPYC